MLSASFLQEGIAFLSDIFQTLGGLVGLAQAVVDKLLTVFDRTNYRRQRILGKEYEHHQKRQCHPEQQS